MKMYIKPTTEIIMLDEIFCAKSGIFAEHPGFDENDDAWEANSITWDDNNE